MANSVLAKETEERPQNGTKTAWGQTSRMLVSPQDIWRCVHMTELAGVYWQSMHMTTLRRAAAPTMLWPGRGGRQQQHLIISDSFPATVADAHPGPSWDSIPACESTANKIWAAHRRHRRTRRTTNVVQFRVFSRAGKPTQLMVEILRIWLGPYTSACL